MLKCCMCETELSDCSGFWKTDLHLTYRSNTSEFHLKVIVSLIILNFFVFLFDVFLTLD